RGRCSDRTAGQVRGFPTQGRGKLTCKKPSVALCQCVVLHYRGTTRAAEGAVRSTTVRRRGRECEKAWYTAAAAHPGAARRHLPRLHADGAPTGRPDPDAAR